MKCQIIMVYLKSLKEKKRADDNGGCKEVCQMTIVSLRPLKTKVKKTIVTIRVGRGEMIIIMKGCVE